MKTWIMGDVHGQLDKLKNVLKGASLIDCDDNWTGGNDRLVFLGDFVDRGPDGIGVIKLVMKLQMQANNAGGRVDALLGNHDVLLLSAYHFGKERAGGPGGTFVDDWIMNGGEDKDLQALTPDIIEWVSNLPAMMLVGSNLVAHADSKLYLQYGKTIEAVNEAFREVMAGRSASDWDLMLERFSDRFAFFDNSGEIETLLGTYGGERYIHGHTPIYYMTEQNPEEVLDPFTYDNGLCINLDSGMYRGGKGFIFLLPIFNHDE